LHSTAVDSLTVGLYVGALGRRKNVSTIQKPTTAVGVSITEEAAEQVKQFMVQERIATDTAGLRVSATPGGCSGFRYWLNVEEHPLPNDVVVQLDGLRVFLDASSAEYLAGAEIGFVSTADASGFRITNPNESHGCSCDCSEQCPA
jgi:iron-sulfur cluster assembly protein